MGLKSFIQRVIKTFGGVYNYDRVVEKKIKKSIALYQKGGFFYKTKAMRLHLKIREKYGVCIPPSVQVGQNFYIAHGHDINIGRTAVVGNNCRIYPGFYVVASVKEEDLAYEKGKRRHAIIGNDCMCGAKSMIVGAVTIGDNVTIGAGALITKDVPSHTVVKGVNQFRPKRFDEIPEKYRESWLKNNQLLGKTCCNKDAYGKETV